MGQGRRASMSSDASDDEAGAQVRTRKAGSRRWTMSILSPQVIDSFLVLTSGRRRA